MNTVAWPFYVHVCLKRSSELTAIISLKIDILFFVTVIQYVFCIVGSEILNFIPPRVKDVWLCG